MHNLKALSDENSTIKRCIKGAIAIKQRKPSRNRDKGLDLTAIALVRFIKVLTWLRGFLVIFLCLVWSSLCSGLFWELQDNGDVRNLQFWPWSLGVMLEFEHIKRGLFTILSRGFIITSLLCNSSLHNLMKFKRFGQTNRFLSQICSEFWNFLH